MIEPKQNLSGRVDTIKREDEVLPEGALIPRREVLSHDTSLILYVYY
jgi:hypothetical protein